LYDNNVPHTSNQRVISEKGDEVKMEKIGTMVREIADKMLNKLNEVESIGPLQ
jgi:hypothetical protein